MKKRGIKGLRNIEGRKGQVAVFVILAIVIVAVILVILTRANVIYVPFLSGELNPNTYLRDCVEPNVRESIDLLSKQGGYSDPEGFILYNDNKVKYLCYTNKYYEQCVVQQPAIKNHFEMELGALLNQRTRVCADNLKNVYEGRGYDVSAGDVSTEVRIVTNKIEIDFIAPMTVTKDVSQTFRKFEIEIDSKIYDLLLISTSIVDFELTFGDSETTLYYQYYPNLVINKNKLSDGTTIYGVSDVTSGEEFVFASRSVAWPAGYGFDQQ